MNDAPKNRVQWRDDLHAVIFEAETPVGKWFDILRIGAILASVFAVMLDSVTSINIHYGPFLTAVEWFFTDSLYYEDILDGYSTNLYS